ncbi:MAG: SDR family oxidoreductase [Candidatus Binatia bacterium]
MVSPWMRAVIVSASSDIGVALGRRWCAAGHVVVGTYRTRAPAVTELEAAGASLVPCDLADPESVRRAGAALRALCPEWDVLVVAGGTLDPVEAFADCDVEAWAAAVDVNFTSQMRVVHALLPVRRVGAVPGPLVLFFAGGGANDAPVGSSAYTVAKIALTKMCELLAAEVADTRFVILGPGWVRTKIHDAILRAGTRAGARYERTREKLASHDCTPMADVLDCCDWLVGAAPEVVTGRNFSVAHDRWGSVALADLLRGDAHLYKLRRAGNACLPREE